MDQDWQFNKSALECHKYMLEHSIATDVTFVVSQKFCNKDERNTDVSKMEPKTFKAHKYQLSSRSPVFYAMFHGPLAEKGDVTIDDIYPAAFKQMLNYVYTDVVDFDEAPIPDIMLVARKYLIPGLTEKCVFHLQQGLCVNNACDVLEKSLFVEEKALEKSCLQFIEKETEACLNAPSVKHIQQSTLSKILDVQRFSVSELDVFVACIMWAKANLEMVQKEITGKDMRAIVGDCVTKIRYPTMKFQDFGSVVVPGRILLPEEELQIFRFLSNKENCMAPLPFLTENRHIKGPFTLIHEGFWEKKMSLSQGCTMKYDVTCNQDITIEKFILGKMEETSLYVNIYRIQHILKVELKCTKIHINDISCKFQSIHTDELCMIELISQHFLRANETCSLEVEFGYRNPFLEPLSCSFQVEYIEADKIDLTDKKTGLNVTIASAQPKIFLLGLVYDYEY